MLPGGKGINVSTVLYNLGIETKALGFSAGFTGKEIERRMAEIGFTHDFISLPGGVLKDQYRNLKDFDGTEINGMGTGYQSGECRISDAETGYTDVRGLSGTGRKHSGKYAEDDLS